MDLITILLIGTTIAILVLRWLHNKVIEELVRQNDEMIEAAKQESASETISIKAKSESVLGVYQEHPIHQFLQTDNNEAYVFESIAVEIAPNTYHRDYPDRKYVMMNNCLVYRQITAEEINTL